MSYGKIFYHIAASTVLIVLVPIMSVFDIGAGCCQGLSSVQFSVTHGLR